MMRTTLSIDDEIANQLMQATGEKNHSSAIRHALQAYLKQIRKEKLLALRGNVDIADNWQELRALDKDD